MTRRSGSSEADESLLALVAQLRVSEARFRAVFDRAAVGIVLADLDGRVLETNRAFRDFLGYAADELVGLRQTAYTPGEDQPLMAEMMRRVTTGEAERAVFEKRYIRRGGAIVWGQLTLSCIVDEAGAPLQLIGMVEDITARKEAQAALEEERRFLLAMLENLSDGIIACDADDVTMFNRPMRELGMAFAGSVLARGAMPAARVYAADGRTPLASDQLPLARAMRHEVVLHEEMLIIPPDGRPRAVLATGRAFHDANGRRLGAVAALHDITEHKLAQEALIAARDEAESANRAKSEFLARMSHELRTPLNSIIGFANVVRRNRAAELPPQELTYLERIDANGRHLLSLINDLLDLSRIEAGRLELALAPVALDVLVRETLAELEPQAHGRPLALEAELPPALAPLVTDAGRLKQVLINLVGNALKFTERGSVRVIVVADGEHRARRIDVVDTGIGIAPERLEAIFEPFVQAESTTTRRFGGTGLGLAISRSLCELLGYRLEARSVAGEGTVMSILLGM